VTAMDMPPMIRINTNQFCLMRERATILHDLHD
jgi:hypothetical protein